MRTSGKSNDRTCTILKIVMFRLDAGKACLQEAVVSGKFNLRVKDKSKHRNIYTMKPNRSERILGIGVSFTYILITFSGKDLNRN